MHQKSLNEDDLPHARTHGRKWRFSLIWTVPLVAALVAGYLVYRRVSDFRGTITIRFLNVEGLKPGQTPVQYRGADAGTVTRIELSPDSTYATVEVKLRRFAPWLARQGSVFWIVRPQVNMGNLTGLGTLITGPYITVQPGQGAPVSEFVAVEESPLMIDPQGLQIVLLADHSGSLRPGVPIYYRGIEVGTVRETRLSTNAVLVEIHGVIRQRFASLVRPDSKFWNVAGLDVRMGLFHGAEVNVESLKSLLLGGIAFATPPGGEARRPLTHGLSFRLFDEPEKAWSEWSPEIYLAPEGSHPSEPQSTRDLSLPGSGLLR